MCNSSFNNFIFSYRLGGSRGDKKRDGISRLHGRWNGGWRGREGEDRGREQRGE